MQFRHIFDHTSSLDIAVPHEQVGKPRSKPFAASCAPRSGAVDFETLSGSSTQP
jgi:hypothetical protein